MQDTCNTVRVVASDPAQGPFVVINEDDFDAAIHTLFAGGAEAAQPQDDPAPLDGGPLDRDHDGHPGGSEPAAGLTKAEIVADLEAMGVAFDPRWNKPELLALRNSERALRDAATAPAE